MSLTDLTFGGSLRTFEAGCAGKKKPRAAAGLAGPFVPFARSF
jgi:hypothetical protein